MMVQNNTLVIENARYIIIQILLLLKVSRQFHFLLCIQCKVWVDASFHWPELESTDNKEDDCGKLVCKCRDPYELIWQSSVQKIDYNSCKVYVRDNHDVKLPKQYQFTEDPCCFIIMLCSFSHMTNGPYNWEENSTTTQNIHNVPDISPGEPVS